MPKWHLTSLSAWCFRRLDSLRCSVEIYRANRERQLTGVTQSHDTDRLYQELSAQLVRCFELVAQIIKESAPPAMPAARAESANAPAQPSKILIDATEAAKRLSIHVNTLAKIPQFELPKVRIGPSKRGVRYRVSDIDAYVRRLHDAAMQTS